MYQRGISPAQYYQRATDKDLKANFSGKKIFLIEQSSCYNENQLLDSKCIQSKTCRAELLVKLPFSHSSFECFLWGGLVALRVFPFNTHLLPDNRHTLYS